MTVADPKKGCKEKRKKNITFVFFSLALSESARKDCPVQNSFCKIKFISQKERAGKKRLC